MDRMKVGECLSDAPEIVLMKRAADVDVLREERHSVGHRRIAADDHHVDFMVGEAEDELIEVWHGAALRPLGEPVRY